MSGSQDLYYLATVPDNTRHRERIDPGRAGATQRPGARFERGAGGHDVVDQQHARPGETGAVRAARAESASDVAGARSPGERALRGRRTHPDQRVGEDATPLDQGIRQERRLVVAAGKQPPAVERHRHHPARLGHQIRRGGAHPGGEGAGGFGTIAVLEGQQHPARSRVVAKRSARAIVGQRRRQTGTAMGTGRSR